VRGAGQERSCPEGFVLANAANTIAVVEIDGSGRDDIEMLRPIADTVDMRASVVLPLLEQVDDDVELGRRKVLEPGEAAEMCQLTTPSP
jgi:hypothetical protein